MQPAKKTTKTTLKITVQKRISLKFDHNLTTKQF